MGFIGYIKGLIGRLFAIKDIKTAFGIEAAVTQEMAERIATWYRCYAGSASWLEKGLVSLRLEQSIVREFANITLNEMSAKIDNATLDDIFQLAIRDLNIHLQEGLATGAMIIKPLGESNVQYVSQHGFIPIEYDSRGRLLKVIFPEFKKLGDKYYTRLEYHSLTPDKGLEITNKAFYSADQNTLGREINLENIDEWANLEPYIRYPKMLRPAFGYYKNPIKNTIDGSHGGVSMFDCALNLIKQADTQFGRLDWEFESAERKVFADLSVLNEKGKLSRRDKGIFKLLDLDAERADQLLKEFSPALRQDGFIAGLEEYKRNIEFEVGLSYGDISNPQTVEKTATEIVASKKRKYNTVTAIQNNLRDCLDDLAYALAFHNSLATKNYNFICDFKDSILVDEETERQQDRSDLASGIMRKEEYRAKWYGETIEEAMKNLPEVEEVIE